MGFLSNIFGRKRTKFDLIRDLIKERLREYPMATAMGATPEMVDQQPDQVLLEHPRRPLSTSSKITTPCETQAIRYPKP